MIETEINEILKKSEAHQKEINELEKEKEDSLKLKEKEKKQIELNKRKEEQIIHNLEKNLEALEKKVVLSLFRSGVMLLKKKIRGKTSSVKKSSNKVRIISLKSEKI